jgi:hypothetical protein
MRRTMDVEGAYLAACMTYSNHAIYLREWIEFHRLVGFEKFFLYDNGSTDDHLEVLAPYLHDGSVVLQDWPGLARQFAAFDHCLETRRAEARWVAFIDIDEFIFSAQGQPVSEILRDYERWPGVGLNAAHFGTSGHLTRPEALVTESYRYRGRGRRATWIKTIVDPKRTTRCVGAHNFVYESGHAVDLLKRPIADWHTESVVLDPVRINHYYTKSVEEFKVKFSRPRADSGELRPWSDLERLLKLEERYVRDDAIQIYVPRLRAAVQRAGSTDAVA